MEISFKKVLAGLFFSAIFLLIVSAPARTQVLARSGEVAGTVGYDHTVYSPSGGPTSTHFFGASGGYNLTPQVTVLGEYKYDPLNFSEGGITYHDQLFGGAARYNFLSSERIVPFAVAGVGSFRMTASEGSLSVSNNGYYFNFGGGASIYLARNWGVRPEYRWERQHDDLTGMVAIGHVSNLSASIFYQFGGRGKRKN